MEALIAELETATEGSRELDGKVAVAIFTATLKPEDAKMTIGYELAWVDSPTHEKGYCLAECQPFSTSRDAALPWENIEVVALYDVVPGEPLGEVWEAWHVDRDTNHGTRGAGHTEALARRIASLKARQAMEE